MVKNGWIKWSLVVCLGLVVCLLTVSCQMEADIRSLKEPKNYLQTSEEDMQWWRQARFGLFVHWGPVSLKGTEIGWSRGNEVPVEVYDNLYKQFNPVKFNANEWVNLAKASGMKYIVITSKHHDGFCLFNSRYTDYDMMSTPFKRDILRELADECRRQKIKLCLYYSIIDWYHPDYLPRGAGDMRPSEGTDFSRYITYMKKQVRELITNYGPLGVLWFDGEWEPTWTHEQGKALYSYVKSLQPGILINNRVDKGREGMKGTTKNDEYAGDFDTPEQEVGAFQIDRPWETCMTLCSQWAWKPNDQMKSLKECIQTFVQVVGGDGNLLFNVGPMPDGRIEPRQAQRLREMGNWLRKYGQSIYATRGGPFKPGDWGASTHKGNRIYVHILKWDGDSVKLPGISKSIVRSSVLTGGKARVEQTEQGIEISVPARYRKDIDTIVVLELDGPAGEAI